MPNRSDDEADAEIPADEQEPGGEPSADDKPNGMETQIAVTGLLEVDQKDVPVSVVFGQGFFMQLDRPASLGNSYSFGRWLADSWDANVNVLLPKKDGQDVKPIAENKQDLVQDFSSKTGIPKGVSDKLVDLMLAEITITDLLIDSRKEDASGAGDEIDKSQLKLRVGLSVKFQGDGLELLPRVALRNLGLLVMRAPEGYEWPKKLDRPDDMKAIDVEEPVVAPAT